MKSSRLLKPYDLTSRVTFGVLICHLNCDFNVTESTRQSVASKVEMRTLKLYSINFCVKMATLQNTEFYQPRIHILLNYFNS
jgi:hypothetical protein